MTHSSSDFSVSDFFELLWASTEEYIKADPARQDVVRRGDPDEVKALLIEGWDYFQTQLSKRAGGTYIYGLRELELQQREKAIAEAMAVRPALSMVEVFRRAGVSKSAGYRILARANRAK